MQNIRFQVLGFDVDVQPGFFMLLGVYLLFGLRDQDPLWQIASACAVVFVGILIHELGHASMARRFRLRVHEVALHGMGGHAMIGHSGTPRQHMWVSLAGPGIGLVMGLPAVVVLNAVELSYPLYVVLHQWAWVNAGWALFNLLPIRPWDGGNALAYGLEGRWRSERRALRVAASVGAPLGALVALYAFTTANGFLFLFGAIGAWTNFQTLQQVRA